MNFFNQIFHNQILMTAIVSWALAQLIKRKSPIIKARQNSFLYLINTILFILPFYHSLAFVSYNNLNF